MSILRYWRYRKARKKTIGSLQPWIELARRHFGGLVDQRWQSPYLRGFLPMLITKFAQQNSGGLLDREQLGLIQLEVWMEFTGQFHDGIGEDITAYDGGLQSDFERGCRNAVHFFAVLNGQPGDLEGNNVLAKLVGNGELHEVLEPTLRAEDIDQLGVESSLAISLWLYYFNDQ